MGATNQVTLKCDAPGCKAFVCLEGTTRADLGRKFPSNWWRSDNFTPVLACPEHAEEARAVEQACHDWNVRECEARNKWMKKNPSPKVPRWLERGLQ